MNLLFYIPFAYMLIHFVYLGLKLGEKFKFYLDEITIPIYQNGIMEKKKLDKLRRKLRFHSLFQKKAKLILRELDVAYEQPLNKELVEELTNKKIITEKIYEVVRVIFHFRERKAYDSFSFDDNLDFSRALQFFETKKEIEKTFENFYYQTVYVLYEKGNLLPEEKLVWENRFIEKGLLAPEDVTKKVESLGQIMEEIENEEEEFFVQLRDVRKRRKIRFDKAKEYQS